MGPVLEGGVVAVTGAAGFIGSWVVRQLLDRGFRVRACVRDATSEKAAFLRALPQVVTGRLTLHSCDINEEGVFDSVFAGCHGVLHVADQLMSGEHALDKHPAAVLRTVNHIVASVNKSGTVGRLVYTSSVAAVLHESDFTQFVKRPVMWDGRYPGEQFTNEQYKANLKANGYAVAKIQAELAVTAAAAASNGKWDAVIALPGDNFGPVLAPHHIRGGGGVFDGYVARLLQGKKVAMLSSYHPMWPVDVRDTAAGHVNLLCSAALHNGERHLLVSTEKLLMEDLCARVASLFPESARLDPTAEALDKESAQTKKNEAYLRRVWGGVQLRNDGATRAGTRFRPLVDTLRDTAESLIGVCGVQPRVRPPSPSAPPARM